MVDKKAITKFNLVTKQRQHLCGIFNYKAQAKEIC